MTLETEVQKLRKEGKKYKEISQILNCKISLISYYSGYKKTIQNRRKEQSFKDNTKVTLKKLKDRNREFIKNYLLDHPCVDCSNKDLRVLDFDHIKGNKVDSISRLVRNAVSLETLKVEIEKCEVRCSNCHRIVTFERRLKNQIKTE